MAAYTFEDMGNHIEHDIVCVKYGEDGDGKPVNVAVECETCGMVLFDLHPDEHYEKYKTEGMTQYVWSELTQEERVRYLLDHFSISEKEAWEIECDTIAGLPDEIKGDMQESVVEKTPTENIECNTAPDCNYFSKRNGLFRDKCTECERSDVESDFKTDHYEDSSCE